MGAPEGNEYWRLRSKHGKDKQYPTPEGLSQACDEYFVWCQQNPLKEQVVFHSQGKITHSTLNKMRAFTLHGLCNFLDLSVEGWKLYKNRKDYVGVTTRAEQIIYTQKFEGAAAGFLNANIIARDLGLTDKQDLTSGGEKIQQNVIEFAGKKVTI